MIPTMMDSKVFEKIFDAWNLATVASTVWGPDSDMAKNAQSAFYSILNSVDDDTKLVEITDSKVLAHINNLVPGLAQAGNA